MRRRLAAVAAVLLCLAGGVVTATAAPDPVLGWVVTRTGPGPAVLRGTFTGSADNATATAVMFALSGHGRERRMNGGFTTARIDWGADGWPRVYGGLQPDCPAACTNPVDTPARLTFSSNGRGLDATVYVATWDVVDVSVDVTTPGWRVRPWRPSMRTVRSDRAGAVGVRALHTTAGTFSAAEAPGGRHGSFAWGRLPCDENGQGSARFSGGRHERTLHCDGSRTALSDTTGTTTWRLAGEAVGMAAVINVLVVVDFPAETRRR